MRRLPHNANVVGEQHKAHTGNRSALTGHERDGEHDMAFIKIATDCLDDLAAALVLLSCYDDRFTLASDNMANVQERDPDTGMASLVAGTVMLQVADALRAIAQEKAIELANTPARRPRHVCAEIEPYCHLSTGECRHAMDSMDEYADGNEPTPNVEYAVYNRSGEMETSAGLPAWFATEEEARTFAQEASESQPQRGQVTVWRMPVRGTWGPATEVAAYDNGVWIR